MSRRHICQTFNIFYISRYIDYSTSGERREFLYFTELKDYLSEYFRHSQPEHGWTFFSYWNIFATRDPTFYVVFIWQLLIIFLQEELDWGLGIFILASHVLGLTFFGWSWWCGIMGWMTLYFARAGRYWERTGMRNEQGITFFESGDDWRGEGWEDNMIWN